MKMAPTMCSYTKGIISRRSIVYKQYLAAFLLSLNLLAFLFHTVLQWCDERYALIRKTLARRQTFFDDIRALTRYKGFDDRKHVMPFRSRS